MQKVIVHGFMLILCAVGLFLSTSAIAGGVPKWVTKVPVDKENLYFVGIKTGAQTLEEGKRSAINQAVTELVEHFEVRSKTRYYEKKTEIEIRLLDEIDSKSGNTRLKGLLLKDWYFERTEKGLDVYVLVQYPKAELEKEKQRHQNIIAEKTSLVRRVLKRGVDAWGKGDIKTAFLSLAEALEEANYMEDEGLRREAIEGLRSLLQGIEIETVSGKAQGAEAFKGLKEPLVAKVYVRSGGAEVPLKGIPVLFTVSDDEGKGEVVFTDEKGFASYHGLKVKTTSGPLIVAALLEPEGFLPYAIIPKPDKEAVESYIEALGQEKAVFTINPVAAKKNVRVSISVSGEDADDESIVLEAISAGLANAGYEVVAVGDDDKANITITGRIRARKGSGNMNWTYSSHADGFIKAVDRSSGKVVAQKNITAVGFGETEELAEANAVKKLATDISGQLIEKIVKGGD